MNEYVFIAAGGGFVYNILQLLELQNKSRESRPDFKDVIYWLPYLAWPILGGFLAYVYQTPENPLSKLLALHIGVSCPLIFRQMVQILPVKVKLTDENQ
jgi:hypothetical protein